MYMANDVYQTYKYMNNINLLPKYTWFLGPRFIKREIDLNLKYSGTSL